MTKQIMQNRNIILKVFNHTNSLLPDIGDVLSIRKEIPLYNNIVFTATYNNATMKEKYIFFLEQM